MDAIVIEFGAFGALCFACGYLLGKLYGMMTQIRQPPRKK